MTMKKTIRLIGALVGLALLSACATQGDGADDMLRTETHNFEEIAPGVYFVTGTGVVNVASNALVVVNEKDVLVVDSHISADAARELIASIAQLTDKPIRQLVNTHFHFDHAHGNQVFPEGTAIIGHEYTAEKLAASPLSENTYRVIGSTGPQRQILAQLEAQLEGASGDARDALEMQRAALIRHIAALERVVPTPPNVTFNDRMSVRSGDRVIQLLHLGRGHTGGDVVVYLPEEKVAFTGDLLYPGAPYLGDAFADEFPATLERLKQLDLDIIAGGHGGLMRGKTAIETSQAYLRDYWGQVARSFAQGRSVDEAVAALDLSAYREFAAFQLTAPGVLKLEVARMYERLRAR